VTASAQAASLPIPRVTSARIAIAAAWAGSRLLVFAVAAAAQEFGLPKRSWRPGFGRHPFELLVRWDGHWYREIAHHGYLLLPDRHSDPAFFPLLPVILRALDSIGVPMTVAGLVLANVGFLLGLLFLYELVRQWLPEADARRAAVYAAIFPLSYVCSMAYPEGLAFAAVTGAGVLAVRGRWLSCASAATAAALLRPESLLVAIPIAALAFRRRAALGQVQRMCALAAAAAAPAGVAAFALYQWWALRDPFAWLRAEHAWHRRFAVHSVWRAAAEFVPGNASGWVYRDILACIVYVALLVCAFRAGVPRAWVLAGAGMVLLPVCTGSFVSDGRYGLLALPVFAGLSMERTASRRRCC
jgi:hypothetical protein